jgi:nitrous oxidase accessory protein
MIILFLLATGIFAGSHITRTLASDYTDVSVTVASIMIEQKPLLVILDVRNQSEYDSGHIRNAKLIAVWQLAARLNELSKSDEILVYCQKGARSQTASLTLADNGFLHVYNMLEGITEWISASYPVYIKYPSLQEAINNASEGDTINVSSGLYYEHLTINKPLTLNGENKYTTMIDGSDNGTVINVKADNTTVTELTIQYSGCSCSDYSGIYIKNYHQNVNIANNLIVQNGYGIKLIWANNTTIDNNEVTNNTSGVEVIFSYNNTIAGNNISNNFFGLDLNPSSNNTIIGNNIANNSIHGIMFRESSNENILLKNNMTGSSYGVRLYTSFNNTFKENNILNNTIGIDIQNSTDNTFIQNNFNNNKRHVQFFETGYTNLWDDGYLSAGNYWSNHTGVDSNHDGISDSPQVLDSSNKDNYPLMGKFYSYTTSTGKTLDMISNSTIEDFQYSEPDSTIRIHVSSSSQNQRSGFFRATIPHDLMLPPYNLTINGDPTNYATIHENDTLSIIYFAYQHSTLEIDIIPEFPTLTLLLLFMMLTLLAFAASRRKHSHNLHKRALVNF